MFSRNDWPTKGIQLYFQLGALSEILSIFVTLQAGFELVQNLTSGFFERSCAVVITILNIFHKFILNKIILCNDRDPHWINKSKRIKHLIKRENLYFKNTFKHSRPCHLNLNKAGLFEGSFFWWRGVNLTPRPYFKKNSSKYQYNFIQFLNNLFDVYWNWKILTSSVISWRH